LSCPIPRGDVQKDGGSEPMTSCCMPGLGEKAAARAARQGEAKAAHSDGARVAAVQFGPVFSGIL
jgi:hypothetical protein